jgi:peptide-methionine (R)-S-oxide reductase
MNEIVNNAKELSEEEWKEKLTEEEYKILRLKGTEPGWSGKFNKFKETGVYTCAGCIDTLFTSDSKYDSGSGWPSFYDIYKTGKIKEHVDQSHGMARVEVLCSNCGGHLGHKFDDGPAPTGQRYCVNSGSLNFIKKKE